MKKMISSFALLLICASANAQATFPTINHIDVNNISQSILVHGDMWWDPVLQVADSHFPATSGKSMNFASAIWMSGYDAGNNLHVAAQTYRQDGNDYWPGPLNSSDTVAYGTSFAWAKIWKVNRSEIQYFQALTTRTVTNVPDAILTWPAKGNAYALGNARTALTITTDMAPFVDVNSNGIYEPLLGDYPDVKGDQALWWVFSDNGVTHAQTKGRPTGVEVHAMAYAYNRGTLIDDVVYYDYYFTNKSANNYTNFRFGLWDDVDLGYYLDDFIGFDSTWRMGIDYNGTNDEGISGGHPINSYGHNPPHSAVTMIVLPGDVGTNYVPVGSFTYYNNDFSIIGNPGVDTEYNNYLRAKLRNGQHFTNDFTGPGVQSKGYGSGPDCNYVFTGDPGNNSQWSECACNNNPGDRRFIIASNDFTFNSGSTQHVVFAQIVADSAGGCPVTSFSKIKTVADTAWHDYFNPPPPKPAGTTDPKNNSSVKIYPNPAHDMLFVVSKPNAGDETITIYNTLGQTLNLPFSKNGQRTEVNISTLPAGLYYLLYRNADEQVTTKFLKE